MIIGKLKECAELGGWFFREIEEHCYLISRPGSSVIIATEPNPLAHSVIDELELEHLCESLLTTNRFKFYTSGTMYVGYFTGDYLGMTDVPRAFIYREGIVIVDELICHNYYDNHKDDFDENSDGNDPANWWKE